MHVLKFNPALRQLLRQESGLTDDEHLAQIEALRPTYAHSIRFIAKRRDETCASYALALTDNPTYRALAGTLDVFAGKGFMSWAVGNRLLEIDEPRTQCLVCYFSGTEWTHVGVMTTLSRVLSKWGTYPQYEHELAEVTDEYGDHVKFYERPSPAECLEMFIAFAHHCGVSAEDISQAVNRWSE
jgi:acyl-CoA synthetase (AMP-forming)/AMP-acid ligase II